MPSNPDDQFLEQAKQHLKSFKQYTKEHRDYEATRELVWALDCIIRDKEIENLLKDAPTNRFHDCETVESLMYQVVGAGSACWEKVNLAGVFDSTEAKKVADEGLQRLVELRREDKKWWRD